MTAFGGDEKKIINSKAKENIHLVSNDSIYKLDHQYIKNNISMREAKHKELNKKIR